MTDSADEMKPPAEAASDNARLIATIQRDWALEMDGMEMYAALARREKIPERRALFEELSALERKHADKWGRRVRELGGEIPATHSGKAHATRFANTPGGMQQIILAI